MVNAPEMVDSAKAPGTGGGSCLDGLSSVCTVLKVALPWGHFAVTGPLGESVIAGEKSAAKHVVSVAGPVLWSDVTKLEVLSLEQYMYMPQHGLG